MPTFPTLQENNMYRRIVTVLENYVEDGQLGWKRSAVNLLVDLKGYMEAEHALGERIHNAILLIKERVEALEERL